MSMLTSVIMIQDVANADLRKISVDDDRVLMNRQIKVAPAGDFVPNQVIVCFQEVISSKEVDIVERFMGQIIDRNNALKLALVQIAEERTSTFIENLNQSGLVKYIERNFVDTRHFIPNDPDWNLQWNLPKIQANATWDLETGSTDVVVAVVDSGIDYNHTDLASNYLSGGYDWSDDDPDPYAFDDHGTHVAGIIAAITNNSLGVAGIAQVKIVAEKMFGVGPQSGTHWALAQAIINATDLGAKIISYSGGGTDSSTKYEAVKYAYDHDVLIVSSAGNDNTNSRHNNYPAAYDEVVSVSATNLTDGKAWYSNWGDWIEISAPGGDEVNPVYSTVIDSYDNMYGTSMACPHVSGVAALVWSHFPEYARDQVRYLLRSSADDLGDPGWDQIFGFGKVNAFEAIQGLFVPETTIRWAGQNIELRDVAWKPPTILMD